MKYSIAALLVILPATVFARQPAALHPISWYEEHPEERAATLRICHGDASYSRLLDCQNAEAAAAVGDRQWSIKNNSLNFLFEPGYYRAHPSLRDTVLMQCGRRAVGDELAFPYCSAAAAGR